MQQCFCSDSDDCNCSCSTDSNCSSDTSEEQNHQKEKILMAQIADEEELKILSQIQAMEEGEMKNRLTEPFMEQLSTRASKNSGNKSLFIDASFERNTKSFQRHQEKHDRVRSLTLGEVSCEIHIIKSEISAMKSQIAELRKGKQMVTKE